jgi:hypothetical protein
MNGITYKLLPKKYKEMDIGILNNEILTIAHTRQKLLEAIFCFPSLKHMSKNIEILDFLRDLYYSIDHLFVLGYIIPFSKNNIFFIIIYS